MNVKVQAKPPITKYTIYKMLNFIISFPLYYLFILFVTGCFRIYALWRILGFDVPGHKDFPP